MKVFFIANETVPANMQLVFSSGPLLFYLSPNKWTRVPRFAEGQVLKLLSYKPVYLRVRLTVLDRIRFWWSRTAA